jgi:hypothetical protein
LYDFIDVPACYIDAFSQVHQLLVRSEDTDEPHLDPRLKPPNLKAYMKKTTLSVEFMSSEQFYY